MNTRLLHSSILISCSGVCLLSQTPSLPQRSQTRGWPSQWWLGLWPPFVSWRLPSSSARSLHVSSTSSIVASSNASEVSPSKLQDTVSLLHFWFKAEMYNFCTTVVACHKFIGFLKIVAIVTFYQLEYCSCRDKDMKHIVLLM